MLRSSGSRCPPRAAAIVSRRAARIEVTPNVGYQIPARYVMRIRYVFWRRLVGIDVERRAMPGLQIELAVWRKLEI